MVLSKAPDLALRRIHREWQIAAVKTTLIIELSPLCLAIAVGLTSACGAAGAGATDPVAAHAGGSPPDTAGLPTGDVHDFDFYIGEWNHKNRRLKERGVASQDWDEFPAITRTTQYLGGMVNVGAVDFPTKGWSGVTVRAFDPERRQWFIYWISSRKGVVGPPQVGGFTGNRGEFYGEDEDDGRPIKVRYTWIKTGPDSARWEQAFSYDGKTWETNWTSDLVRAAR
jgi:hypothetical protein